MAHNSKQTELKPKLLGSSTEDVSLNMRRSFSWDRAFFTSDGFLDAEELSSVIEGGGNDVKNQLQKIEEIETLEAKLFEEIEASTKKSTGKSNQTNSSINVSSGKRDAQPKKVTRAVGPYKAAQLKTLPRKSSSLSGCNNVKPLGMQTRRNMISKTGKATNDSPSKTPPGIMTKNKATPFNKNRVSRTSPSSPISSGSSSSSKAAVNRQSSRGNSVPSRSSLNNEKISAINARRTDEWKNDKPTGGSMAKIPSTISLNIKPPPVSSQSSSPIGTSVKQRSKSTPKIHPTIQTTDRNGKPSYGMPSLKGKSYESRLLVGFPNSGATHSNKSGIPNDIKARKLPTAKTVATNTGLKLPNSQRTTTPSPKSSKKQAVKSSSRASSGMQNIFLVSPEVMDIKGKLNDLKIEISMQKKDRCKETKMALVESGKGESSSRITKMNNIQTKLT